MLSLSHRQQLKVRTWDLWILDGLGLVSQGVLVPLGQLALSSYLLSVFFPSFRGMLSISWWSALTIHFFVVDYIYYWVHRGMHSQPFWWLHRVHHTAEGMDFFISSRNSLWTPLFLPYIWLNGVMVFLLNDARPFLVVSAISSSLDLYRHTGSLFSSSHPFVKFFGKVFITSQDHAWHHSTHKSRFNFSANLKLWDIFHGTYYHSENMPQRYGIPFAVSLWRKIFWPVEGKR